MFEVKAIVTPQRLDAVRAAPRVVAQMPGPDTSRVTAGAVTGLGSLGAGAILKSGDVHVRCLTTRRNLSAESTEPFPKSRDPHRTEHG